MTRVVSHENIEIALEASDDVLTITQQTITHDENAENNENSSSADEKSASSDKKPRRVTFPIDEQVVSGYMEPPNPWTAAKTCSTDELVAVYLNSCEKQGIKPVPKLLNQMMAISDFSDRNETLSLRGEKLDIKQCETLEEILKRVQFRTIDLEATHLEDECGIAIFDMIEYYESATRLNLSYNRLSPRGWQACARMIKKTPCLDTLEARNCQLNEQSIPLLARTIRIGCHLTVLHLENSSLSGRPLMILVSAIKMNEVLRNLFLADNRLMPSDGIHLGNMLKFNHTLELLDLRCNHLQDTGCNHICSGLSEQNADKGLLTLVFWNNQITYQAMPSLTKALILSNCLETINLGHNNIGNEGIHQLKDGLLRNRSLLRIGLQAAKISCEGAIALAEYITEARKLLRIDLRENEIKTAGLMALSLALKVSESVTRLDLDREPKKETLKDFAIQQRQLLTNINDFMTRNRELQQQREENEERERLKLLEKDVIINEDENEIIDNDLQISKDTSITHNKEFYLNRKNLHLNISKPNLPNATVLESPGFTTENAMVRLNIETSSLEKLDEEHSPLNHTPPNESNSSFNYTSPSEQFPPSPMTSSDGHCFLKPVSENATLSPNLSPRSSKKFIVNRVKDDTNDNLRTIMPSPTSSPTPPSTINEECLGENIKNTTSTISLLQSTPDNEVIVEDSSKNPSLLVIPSTECSSFTSDNLNEIKSDLKADNTIMNEKAENENDVKTCIESLHKVLDDSLLGSPILNGDRKSLILKETNGDCFQSELNDMLVQVNSSLCKISPSSSLENHLND